MLQRIKQVMSALKANVNAQDKDFVAARLTPEEASLFYAMDVVDQRHALEVAYYCHRQAPHDQVLQKVALLHDVGKQKGDLTIAGRIVAVLFAALSPRLVRRIAHPDPSRGIRRQLYIYLRHPVIGEERVSQVNSDKTLLWLIASHHQGTPTNPAPSHEAPSLLKVLQEADDKH